SEIDAYLRETIEALRDEFESNGAPFTVYRGCSKADEQILEVCLPTAAGDRETERRQVAFMIARGAEGDYPRILEAYDAVQAYVDANELTIGGPPCETYLTDPWAAVPEMRIAFPLAG